MNMWAQAVFTRGSREEIIEKYRLYSTQPGKVPLEPLLRK